MLADSVPPAPVPRGEEKRTNDVLAGSDSLRLLETVKIFGIGDLVADIVSYHGEFPPSVVHNSAPLYEVAMLKSDLRVSTVFPSFSKTSIDQIYLRNVLFTRQSFALPGHQQAGFHMTADLLFDESCGELHSTLRNVLGVDNPRIRLHCALGHESTDWMDALQFTHFTLEGIFDELHVSMPIDAITLTQLGVRLIGFQSARHREDGSMKMTSNYGFELFGVLNLQASSWKDSIPLHFLIGKTSSQLELNAQASCEWKSAFGIDGLTLRRIGVGAIIELGQPISTASFEISATLQAGSVMLSLFGNFSLDGQFTLGATLENVDWDAVSEIYEFFFNEPLDAPDMHFLLRSATLILSRNDELVINLIVDHLEIGDFPPASGSLQMSSHGVSVSASISGKAVSIDDFTIMNPHVKLSCVKINGVFKTDVVLGGDFSWQGLNLRIGLHLYASPDSDDLEYTVCGEFMLGDGATSGLRFDRLVPALEHLPALGQLTLDGAAVVVATRENATLPAAISIAYPVRRGFFVCAVIGGLDVVSAITGGSAPKLAVAAGWSSKDGFSLVLRPHSDHRLVLADGVVSEPFELKVALGPRPSLHLEGGVLVTVPKQDEPLRFVLGCALEAVGGKITVRGAMGGMWVNPFGLSEQLKIGNLALSASVLLVGTPDGFGIEGRIEHSSTVLDVKLHVDKDPQRCLIYILVKNLGVREIVSIANALTGLSLPEPPNVLRFDEVELYACASGMEINKKFYPRGFCFHSKMTILGKTAEVKVEIHDNGVVIEGSVDEFTLAGLTVTGNDPKTRKASFNAVLTSSRQSGYIDGVIAVAGARAALQANFELSPLFTFSFDFSLTIVGELEIKVNAGPAKRLESSKDCDISSQRYILNAEFHQSILRHLREAVGRKFEELAQEVEKEAAEIQEGLRRRREQLSRDIDNLKGDLERWGESDEWRREDLMRRVHAVLEENITLDPDSISSETADTLRRLTDEFRDAKYEFEYFKSQIDEALENQRREADKVTRHIPLLGDLLLDASVSITRRIAPVLDENLRNEFKRREIAYLGTQCALLRFVLVDSPLLPLPICEALWPQLWDLERDFHRERNNDALDDLAEELQDMLRSVVVALAKMLLDFADGVQKIVHKAAEVTVAVVSDVAQRTLRLAGGLLTRLLGLLDITDVVLKGELGTGALVFSASVSGTLDGSPFHFTVNLTIGDFTAFIIAIFKWLKDKIESIILS